MLGQVQKARSTSLHFVSLMAQYLVAFKHWFKGFMGDSIRRPCPLGYDRICILMEWNRMRTMTQAIRA